MKRKVLSLLVGFIVFLGMPSRVIAVVDPLMYPNNKIGVHILSPDEIGQAAKLVNNEGNGSWGYVVVPIQATDRNRVTWERFMKKAKELKVIPIIRVATVVEGVHWEEPNNYDLVDFANFLNDLSWPTKNRYVIIFNEVNRADEYGGLLAPERYADILANAITIFKERNEDFFMLPAGLDNAAANSGTAIKWSRYLTLMQERRPEVFSMIDGFVSHSYPNYAFTGRVSDMHDHSIVSFKHDLALLRKFTDKKLPVFITETGWNMDAVGHERAASNYREAFGGPWSDGQIVTVAPFLLMAGDGPFVSFSLLKKDSSPTLSYLAIKERATNGEPAPGAEPLPAILKGVSMIKEGNDAFWVSLAAWEPPKVSGWWQELVNWFSSPLNQSERKIKLGEKVYTIEVADSEDERRRGLSGRKSLPEDEGLLFVFSRPTRPGFWMPDMNFDIDIIWISDKKVVGVSVGEKSKPREILSPPSEVDMVLEVNKGSGIKVGDLMVDLP